MDLFDSIRQRASILADAARQIIISEQQSRLLGIPGYAIWNGFDSRGRETVIINNQVVRVFLNSNTCPPIGTKVYVDETLTVDYKKVYEKPEPEVDGAKIVKENERPKKRQKTVLPILEEEDEDVVGATWLIFHEYLKELDWTTTSGGKANPGFSGFDPLNPVAAIPSISTFIVASLLFTDLEFHFATYTFEMSDIPSNEDHPDIPDGTSSDEYNYFAIMQALYEMLNYANVYPIDSTDGLFLGPAPAISNAMIFLGGGVSGFSFSPKYFLRPWDSSKWTRMQGFLTMFGPGKVQWSVARAVGVYTPKQFTINFYAWQIPESDLPTEYNNDTRDQFPSMIFKQFNIPDDISEWSQLRGNGTRLEDNPALNQNEVIIYEVLPAHDFYDFEEGAEPDLSKFISYSSGYVHANYVIKAYAPWTGIDDSLRINYYTLNLRAQLNVEEENPDIVIDYNLNVSTFNLPPDFTFDGDIYVEDENFPIQAGSGRFAQEPITYRFQGRADPPSVPADSEGTPTVLSFQITRGSPAASGVMTATDVDRNSTIGWTVNNPPPGFVYNTTNGKYIFEPNVAEYEVLASGERFELEFSYVVTDEYGLQVQRPITIVIIGNPDVEIQPEPTPPPNDTAVPAVGMGDYDPAPERDWDPEPFVEDGTTGGPAQSFGGPIETVLTLPDTDGEGNILGWQGRNPKIIIEEVTATIRLNNTLVNDIPFSVSDFGEFSVSDSFDESGKLNGLLCTLDINNLNLDWLTSADELQLTYYISARVNSAPYVGSFEDLSNTQLRKIRSDFIRFAFDTDWRASIHNPRTDNLIFNINSSVEGDSTTRDTSYEYFNIDPTTNTISTDFIREFYMHNLAGIRPDDLEVPLDNQEVYLTNALTYEFDDEEEELLFYWNGIVPFSGYSILGGKMYIATTGENPLVVGNNIQSPPLSRFFGGDDALKPIIEKTSAAIVVNVNAPDTDFVSLDGYVRYVPDEIIPTVAEDVADVVRTGTSIRIGNRWRSVLFPTEYERNGSFASLLDFDPDLSAKTKGYLVFGFLGD